MITLLSIGFFMSFFLITLLIGKKHKLPSDKYLLSMLTVYAFTIGGAYIELFNRNNDYPFPHLMNISWLFLLLHGPLLWLYIKSMTVKAFKFRIIHVIHFIPFSVYCVLQCMLFIRLPESEKIIILQNELFRYTTYFKISVASIGISNLTYNIWALALLRKHRQNIENQFSNIEGINLTWLKTLIIASLIVFSVNVILFNLNIYRPFAGYYDLSKIAYVFATLYVLYLGFFGIRQGKVFVDFQTIDAAQKRNSYLPDESKTNIKKNFTEIIDRLIILMEQERPYLDPEINLARFSELMKTQPKIISEVLNSVLNQNFFDFINKYRIEEFKIQCLNQDKKHLSIMGIAYECGFNSKAAFYRAFNKFEKISPTAYISEVSQKVRPVIIKNETPLM